MLAADRIIAVQEDDATTRKKSKKVPPAPSPLTELCHDALARGVLDLHDGLPDSWLKMFQKHPAAWAQIKEAVLQPVGRREEWLNKESTVQIAYKDSAPPSLAEKLKVIHVPASALPEWLFVLLSAYFQALSCRNPYRFAEPDKCGMGGYQIILNPYEYTHQGLWCDFARICEVAKGALDELYYGTIRRLFQLFELDIEDVYGDFVAAINDESAQELTRSDLATAAAQGDPEVFAREYSSHTNRQLRSEIAEHIVDDLDWAWADNLHDEYEDINENATYFKAPYATLYFDYDDV